MRILNYLLLILLFATLAMCTTKSSKHSAKKDSLESNVIDSPKNEVKKLSSNSTPVEKNLFETIDGVRKLTYQGYQKFFTEKDTLLVVKLSTISKQYNVAIEMHPCYPGGSDLHCMGWAKLKLFHKGRSKPFQIISANVDVDLYSADSTFTTLFFDRESKDLLRFTDLDADGHDDMIIENMGIGYSAYMYRPALKKLVRDTELSDDLALSPSYSIDEKNQTLTVNYFTSFRAVCSQLKKYSLKGKPTLIKEIVNTPYLDYTKSFYHEITRELINGKWNESVKKIVDDELPPEDSVRFTEKFEMENASEKFRVLVDLPCSFGRCGSSGAAKITLLNRKGKVFQVLKVYTPEFVPSEECKQCYDSDNDGYIEYDSYHSHIGFSNQQDFNFDGINDIAIRNNGSGNYGAPTDDVYLYSKRRNQFVFSAELTDLWSFSRDDLTIDPITKTIETSSPSSLSDFGAESFKIVNDKPKLVRCYSTRSFYSEKPHYFSRWICETYLENGHWKSEAYRKME